MTRRAQRGWTLIEAVVTTALMSALLVITLYLFSPTMKIALQEMHKTALQSQSVLLFTKLEKAFQATNASGIAWVSNDPDKCRVLVIHPQDVEGLTNGNPTWKPEWNCWSWDPTTRILKSFSAPPYGGLPVPAIGTPQIPTLAQLQSLQTVSTTGAALMASEMTDFQYRLEPGPLARLEIELQYPVIGTSRFIKVRNERRYFLRIANR